MPEVWTERTVPGPVGPFGVVSLDELVVPHVCVCKVVDGAAVRKHVAVDFDFLEFGALGEVGLPWGT